MAEKIILALFLFTLLAVAVTDWRTMLIPDRYHIVIVALACGAMALGLEPGIGSRLIGLVCVSVPMLALCLLVEGAFGGGDIKLMGACGLLLGWRTLLVSAFFGILLGGVWGIGLLLGKKAEKKDHFAFGPFLCAGMAIGVLWGENILGWYLGLLGL